MKHRTSSVFNACFIRRLTVTRPRHRRLHFQAFTAAGLRVKKPSVHIRAILAALVVAVSAVAAAEKKAGPDEQYKKLTPDSEEHPDVPKGTGTEYQWNDSKIYPGTQRKYWVYVPKQYNAAKPACVFVCQDGVMYKAPTVFDNLIAQKEMPVTIGIFIQPGDF